MPHLVDHTAHRRRVLALHHLMHSPQAEPADGLTHVIGTADEADHPLDLHRATGFLAVVLGPVVGLDGSFCAGHFFFGAYSPYLAPAFSFGGLPVIISMVLVRFSGMVRIS